MFGYRRRLSFDLAVCAPMVAASTSWNNGYSSETAEAADQGRDKCHPTDMEQEVSVSSIRGILGAVEEIIIESCHSTWIIDMENSRFRRVVKGSNHHAAPASTEWQACYGVEIDPLSESFVVLLNPEGTRLLRSWRHVEHCSQCGGEATSELSLRDLRSAVRG